MCLKYDGLSNKQNIKKKKNCKKPNLNIFTEDKDTSQFSSKINTAWNLPWDLPKAAT